jgi:CrcB protein
VKSLLLVAGGGAIGSALRYAVSLLMKPEHSLAFPVHTFCVNIIGCIAIGIVFAWATAVPDNADLRLFLMTGIIGGFTTFSSFGLESFFLYTHGEMAKATVYVLLSNFLGICAVWGGTMIHKLVVS